MCASYVTCLYKKSVKVFNKSDYEINMDVLIFQVNKKTYICHTCHKTLKKGHICTGSFKQLKISFVPKILSNLNRLERVLISRRILFKKIAIIPKVQFPKLKVVFVIYQLIHQALSVYYPMLQMVMAW